MAIKEMLSISDILHAITSALETPVIILVTILVAFVIILLGWTIGEYFSERRHLRCSLPHLLDAICSGEKPLQQLIAESGLLKRQRVALLELTQHPELNKELRTALAVRLLEQEQAHYDRLLTFSDIAARVGPMLGLLGTLIPLGPGVIALGQGDTLTLSTSLLTAFDTTIAGLASAAVALIISTVRRSWYRDYMSLLETLAECIIEGTKWDAAA